MVVGKKPFPQGDDSPDNEIPEMTEKEFSQAKLMPEVMPEAMLALKRGFIRNKP